MRPICKLPFLSKVLEKVVSTQLLAFVSHNNLFEKFQSGFRALHITVSVVNMSFKWMNLLSERSERNHFKNWFIPFSVQLSSATSMPARSGTAATHIENCEDVIHIRTVIRSWFTNLLHTENCRWGPDSRSRTVPTLCQSLTHSGQRSWFTFSNHTA